MNYEQKYKEALKELREHFLPTTDGTPVSGISRRQIEDIFPELAESEDERIRKALVEYFKWNPQQLLNNFNNKEVLDWLETSEQKNDRKEWSEEDEDKMILIEDRFSDYLDYVREDNSLTKYQKNSTKDEIVNLSNWLKSLRPQNHWKPSDEQMRELGVVATGKGFFRKEILRGLLEQLKNL